MPSPLEIFQARRAYIVEQMDIVLSQLLPEPTGPQAQIMEAMRYAVLGGGKRLRPFILIEAARLFGEPSAGVWHAAGALECVHVYSLIHDDLPCMDDDDMRRGKASLHKAYDEAMAVLAGDALLTLAFEIMARRDIHKSSALRLGAISGLAKAAGTLGMIGGQVIDINAPTHKQDEALITHLQALKTGALIRFAVEAGGRLGGAKTADVKNLVRYADALGLAFQIRDDILDVEGDSVQMGKNVGKDAGLGKATFVSIHGLEGARARAKELGETAKAALSPYGDKADNLCTAVDFVLNRQN